MTITPEGRREHGVRSQVGHGGEVSSRPRGRVSGDPSGRGADYGSAMTPRPAEFDRIDDVATRHPALGMLLLLGSRATGTAHEHSDWDFGVLGDPGHQLDLPRLAADLMALVGSDDVDVVDLTRASAVLRRDAATVGLVLVERRPGAFLDFTLEALTFWCDVEPVVRRAHAEVLRSVTA